MEVLRARLLDATIAKQEAERSKMRKMQVGTGDRSVKIRTYNFPQNRVTDHRIGYTMHDLDAVMNGEIDPLIEHLRNADAEDRLGE
jgi:peptide chain release factor 1